MQEGLADGLDDRGNARFTKVIEDDPVALHCFLIGKVGDVAPKLLGTGNPQPSVQLLGIDSSEVVLHGQRNSLERVHPSKPPGFVARTTPATTPISAWGRRESNAASSPCTVTSMVSNPAERKRSATSSRVSAPDEQEAHRSESFLSSSEIGCVARTSATARRPPGRRHPERFAVDPTLIRDEVDYAVRKNNVDGGVCYRDVFDFPEAELDVRPAARASQVAGARYHLGRHVHPDHSTRRTDLTRGQEAVDPRTAAEVEYHLPLPERHEVRGIPASQTEVRPFGDARQFRIRVARGTTTDSDIVGGRFGSGTPGGGPAPPATTGASLMGEAAVPRTDRLSENPLVSFRSAHRAFGIAPGISR